MYQLFGSNLQRVLQLQVRDLKTAAPCLLALSPAAGMLLALR
jgi:hypothetical protein